MAGRSDRTMIFSNFGTGDGIGATNFNGPLMLGEYNGPTTMMLGGYNGPTMPPLRRSKRSSSKKATWRMWSCTSSHLEVNEPKKNMRWQEGGNATTESTTTVSTQITMNIE